MKTLYHSILAPQAVQNRLYDDHAALYYLLLSKWEKGKLSIPTTNPLIPHPRLSHSGVSPIIPHINIHKTESKTSNVTPSGPLVQQQGPLEGLNVKPGGVVNLQEEETEELIKDPNLDRYLKHGRRHTLGAAHNTMYVNPEDMKRSVINS